MIKIIEFESFESWNFYRKYGNNMKDIEILEKGNLIKEALKIVDKLAKSDLGDIDGEFTNQDFECDELQTLIIKARTITKSHWWKLT